MADPGFCYRGGTTGNTCHHFLPLLLPLPSSKSPSSALMSFLSVVDITTFWLKLQELQQDGMCIMPVQIVFSHIYYFFGVVEFSWDLLAQVLITSGGV